MHPSENGDGDGDVGNPKAWAPPATILAWTLALLPALGVPSELVLQDTLKSAVLALGVLVAALFYVWWQRKRTAALRWHGLVWLPLTLVLYALGSMVWSHTYLAAVEALRWGVLGLLLWLGLNAFTRADWSRVAWGIHGGLVVASVWVVLQFWLDLDLFPQARSPASTFINRNFFAEYAVCALPYSVFVLATMRTSRWLVVVALSVALVVVAIMMTGSRSALATMLLLCPVCALVLLRYARNFQFPRWGRSRQVLVCLALAAGVGAMGSVPSPVHHILEEGRGSTALQRAFLRAGSLADTKEYSEYSFYIRALMWKATARMVMAEPLTGVGAGAWEVHIPQYQNMVEASELDYYPHNEYLQLLAEYGVVVGGLFVAVLLAYLVISAAKNWNLAGVQRREVPLRAFGLASLLALLIISSAGFPWHMAGTGALFALSLAVLAGSDARLGYREAFFAARLRWGPGLARTLLLAVFCATLLAVYIAEQAFVAESKLVSAVKLAWQVGHDRPKDTALAAQRKAQALQNVREGIAINPHYRRFTAIVADHLAAVGDWEDAVWIWESVAASRPYIPALWSNLANGYISLHQYPQAQSALGHLQQLQPQAAGTLVLQAVLLGRTGAPGAAKQLLSDYMDHGEFDPEVLRAAYVLGLELHDWPLAIRSLEVHIQHWPLSAAESYFRLGLIYDNPLVNLPDKALEAFRAGLRVAPDGAQSRYRSEVPERYRGQL